MRATAEQAFSEAYEANGLRDESPVFWGKLLSQIEPECVEWLWAERIPLGKLTIFDGDPGLGKSAALTDAAARVSVGRPWPDDTPCRAGGVVICSAEDGEADTLRPRLDAAGGDPEKVVSLVMVPDGEGGERPLELPADLSTLEAAIEHVEAVLVIIDPLMAFLSGTNDAHKDQDVRRALTPLGKLAERTGAAIVAVRHLNKATGGNPLYRGGGSIGIIGAARTGLVVAQDPQDENRRVLAANKSNLSKLAPSLAFTLEEAANGAVRVEWHGETTHGAAALLNAPTDPEERSALEEAVEFLTEALKDGPMWSKQVQRDAAAASISEATLRRAKAGLRIKSERSGDAWVWALPGKERRGQGAHHGE